jgi:hypothetical protein
MKAPDEIVTGHAAKVDPGNPVGLQRLNEPAKTQLVTLLEEYAHNLPDGFGELKAAGRWN